MASSILAFRLMGRRRCVGGWEEDEKNQLLAEAIKCNQNNALAYHHLGASIGHGREVELADSRKMGRQALFLEAIRSDPALFEPWLSLGNCVSIFGTVTLPDGRKMSAKELKKEGKRCRDVSSR